MCCCLLVPCLGSNLVLNCHSEPPSQSFSSRLYDSAGVAILSMAEEIETGLDRGEKPYLLVSELIVVTIWICVGECCLGFGCPWFIFHPFKLHSRFTVTNIHRQGGAREGRRCLERRGDVQSSTRMNSVLCDVIQEASLSARLSLLPIPTHHG